jgi:hypothetical protein
MFTASELWKYGTVMNYVLFVLSSVFSVALLIAQVNQSENVYMLQASKLALS